MKIFKWLFKFSGVGQTQIILKALILFAVGLTCYKMAKGFDYAIDSVKSNITHNSKEYKSLLETKNNLDWALSKVINYSDSITVQKTSDSLSFVEQIKQHQINELTLSRANKIKSDSLLMYRRNKRACYIRESYGLFNKKFRDREIDCIELKIDSNED